MAKVTAPLFSFSASGAIGKALVYFGWKGIPVVRRFVVPANPQSPLQIAQRLIMHNAVDEWHLAKYDAVDHAAWDRYAGVVASAMSGFNAFVKKYIDTTRVPLVPDPGWNGSILTGGAGLFAAHVEEDGSWITANLRWGYSKTDMNTVQVLAEAPASTWTAAGISATVGAHVYGYYEGKNAGGAVLGRTGIYDLLVV